MNNRQINRNIYPFFATLYIFECISLEYDIGYPHADKNTSIRSCVEKKHKHRQQHRHRGGEWGLSTYKSLCPLTWNVPCSRLSRLSCGERIHSGWCYFQRMTDSVPSQSHPCESVGSRSCQARVWRGDTRCLRHRSPRPRWLMCGNDPCMLGKKATREGKKAIKPLKNDDFYFTIL